MATHLIAYQQSVDQATPAAINTVVDDVITRTGTTRFLVPEDYRFVHWAAALGPSLTRAYLVSPSLEVRRFRGEIVPHQRGSESFDLAKLTIYKPVVPLELTATEELEAHVAEDGTGATQVDVLVALGAGELPSAPSGDLRLVRATGTTTLSPRTWTTVSVTMELSLEPGEYSLVAFLPISATAIAARALFVGQVYRPGVPALAGTEAVAREFESGYLGEHQFYEMGRFTHLTVPQFQFFASAADTSETVLMWVVKL
mgnify:CR=1 FL=1